MSAESDTESATELGIESRFGWPIGGAIGGAIGAVAFGVLMWLFDPDILAAIPAIYGFQTADVTGWAIHVAHGVVLGLIFGFLVTRRFVLGILRSDVETEALSRTSLVLRIVGAGFVFGLAIWAILPLLVLPVWTGVFGPAETGAFPTAAVESLIGHVLFGAVLGLVFAATMDLGDRSTGEPLEE